MDEHRKLKALRVIRQQIFYFDAGGVYTCVSRQDAQKMKLEGLKYDYKRKQNYCEDIIGPEARAIACLEIGDTIEKLEKDILRFTEINREAEKNLEIANTVYKVFQGKLYYFNDKGVYTCEKIEDVLPKDIAIRKVKIEKGRKAINCRPYNTICLGNMLGFRDYHVFQRAFARLKPGDTLETLADYCKNDVEYGKRKKPDEIHRFVTKIQKPKFVKKPGSNKAYDYIYVDANIVFEWKMDKAKYVAENEENLAKMILEEIATKKSVAQYKIPAFEKLEIKSVRLDENINVLYYVFALKKD